MGHLYFIRALDTDRVKIGFTRKTAATRLSQLQVGSSSPLEVEHVFQVSEPEHAEALVHKDLRLYRVHGEWFEIDAEHPQAYIDAIVNDMKSDKGGDKSRE